LVDSQSFNDFASNLWGMGAQCAISHDYSIAISLFGYAMVAAEMFCC
jgi:hypothetical protein